jgi:thiamine-monophosphate kinase
VHFAVSKNKDTTVEHQGERAMIELIRQIVGVPQRYKDGFLSLETRLEDDAAVYQIAGPEGLCLVVTTDMINNGTEFFDTTDPSHAGFTSVTVVVSDIVAVGAKPIGVAIAWGLPKNYRVSDVSKIASGIRDALKYYDDLPLIAGDFNESAEVVLSGCALGIGHKDTMLHRRGAKPGDLVAVTGVVGGSTAGYYIEKLGRRRFSFLSKQELERLVTRFTCPRARFREAQQLASTRLLTSMSDLSDGLTSGLRLLSELNEVGVVINEYDIPLDPAARRVIENLDFPWDFLISGDGGDYELILTFPPEARETVTRQANCIVHVIGEVTERKNLILRTSSGEVELQQEGFEHFRHKFQAPAQGSGPKTTL